MNLSPDKRAVLSEAYRLLKPGGEMYFSDVYSGQRVPAALKKDPVLWGECLSGIAERIQQLTATTSLRLPSAPQTITPRSNRNFYDYLVHDALSYYPSSVLCSVLNALP